MTVISATVTVFAKGAAELRQPYPHRIIPFAAHGGGKSLHTSAYPREIGCQCALRRAFVDVGVPAANVDEADAIGVTHQFAHTLGFQLESFAGDRVAISR